MSNRYARESLVLVSNGYENIYERGFCNGLTDSGRSFLLISSDRSDYAGLRSNTRTLNLRGSQDEGRSKREKLLNLFRYHLRLMWYVLANRPKVVHVFGMIAPLVLCGLVEGVIFRLASRRYVLTVHNLLPHDRHTLLNQFLCRMSFHLPSALVVHTQKMRDDLALKYGVPVADIVVMEHGLEPRKSINGASIELATSSPMKILFFGKILKYKGVDVLLAALVDFPVAFELEIAGAVSDAQLKAELLAQISSHPQRQCIKWGGQFVPEEQIEPMFVSSHVVALPYRHIDQSGILFQALRFGTPIVATKVGSFQDYVSEAVGELCERDDPISLRAALLRLHARLGKLSRCDIMAVGNQYEWSSTVRPLSDLYDPA